jgi:hypothetical protein
VTFHGFESFKSSNIPAKKGNCQDPDRCPGFRLAFLDRRFGSGRVDFVWISISFKPPLGSSVWGSERGIACLAYTPPQLSCRASVPQSFHSRLYWSLLYNAPIALIFRGGRDYHETRHAPAMLRCIPQRRCTLREHYPWWWSQRTRTRVDRN